MLQMLLPLLGQLARVDIRELGVQSHGHVLVFSLDLFDLLFANLQIKRMKKVLGVHICEGGCV